MERSNYDYAVLFVCIRKPLGAMASRSEGSSATLARKLDWFRQGICAARISYRGRESATASLSASDETRVPLAKPQKTGLKKSAPVPHKLMLLKDSLLILSWGFAGSAWNASAANHYLDVEISGGVAMHPPSKRSAAEQLQSWRTLGRARAQEDSRLHPRRKVNIPAKIMVGGSTRDCTLLDISDGGARIALEGVQELPDEFQICMTPSGFPFRECKLIWRSNSEMGVEFKSVRPWWV